MEHHRILSPDRLVVWAFFILYAAEAEREQAAAVCWGWHLLFQMLFQQLQRVGISLQALAGDGGEAD